MATRDDPISEEERKRLLAELDAALERGVADIKAGRVHSSEEVWAEVHQRMREARARKAKKPA